MTYDLERFVDAQKYSYEQALAEMKAGRKQSHWIWYIFPQLKGLGRTYNAEFYGLDGAEEAAEYLKHPVLGARLREISGVLLGLESSDPERVMGGHPDDWKLCSCMTLFAEVSEEGSVFHKVLEKFFGGQKDGRTLGLLRTKA